MAMMYEAFETMADSMSEQNDDTRRMATLERFLELKPPKFEGKPDPPISERWLNSVRTIFDTMNVPLNYRIEFATFLFEGDAEAWWDLIEDHRAVRNMNWDEFEQFFQENHVTGDYRLPIVSAFQDLVQGDMMVSEYQTKFIELSRYCPNLVADDEERCVKFREGLRQNIRSMIEPLSIKTFPELVAAAQRAEYVLDENLLREKGSKGKNKDNRKTTRKMIRKIIMNHNQWQSSQGSGTTSGSSSVYGRYNNIGCFKCGHQDHKRKDCPLRQQKGSRLSSKCSQGSQSSSDKLGAQSSQARPEQLVITKHQNQLQGSQVNGNSSSYGHYNPSGCFYCGQQDHKKKNCPLRQQKGSQLSSKCCQGRQSSSVKLGAQSSQARPEQLVIRKHQKQLQGSQINGHSSSSNGRFSPYSCHNCGQGGHFKRSCPYSPQQPSSSKDQI